MIRKKLIIMNRINLLFIFLLGLMVACDEEKRGQYATDSIPPGQVYGVEVENVAGGAIITYSVPSDEDLLYVKVVYRMWDGTQVEQTSSAYTTRIVVEGLGRAEKQTVHLICGDRSGNESAPYPVDIEPLDSPIYAIHESIEITPDFGGIRLTWTNPLKASVVLTVYEVDKNDRLVEVQSIYTGSAEGKYNIRGYPAEETTFAVLVRDRWKNKTDMKNGTYVPFFEEKLDRKKFGKWNPSGIPYQELVSSGVAWSVDRLWDGLLTDPGFSFPSTVTLPYSLTFNMGQTAVLCRIKVFQRTSSNQLFNGYNVKRFQLYASPHPEVNANIATWLFLGDFTSVKPSGLPLGQLSDEDRAVGDNGEDYTIEINDDVPVQYIRVHIMETWGGGMNVAQLYEMEFYGQIIE